MGFQVRIDSDSEAFLQKMRSDPAQIFDKPYKGYLLFLLGHADKQACEWLRASIPALDSLTGDDVAFVLFAARFDFKLHLNIEKPPSNEPRNVGLLPIEELSKEGWNIQRLVRSGRWGTVAEGDELTAMTYAVDGIARRLQILDKLPCVVVLDAIPCNELYVITLSESICERFLELLRKALSQFSKMDGYDQIETDVARLLSLQEEIAVLKLSVQRCKGVSSKWKQSLV